MAEIRYLLDETIETELQNLKSFNGDGKERSAAIDDIVALYKLHIDEIKTEVDAEEKREHRSMERTRQENERADHDREEASAQRAEYRSVCKGWYCGRGVDCPADLLCRLDEKRVQV